MSIYKISRANLYKHICTHVWKRKQHPPLMSFIAMSLMETRESSLTAGTLNPHCFKVILSGERVAQIQKPNKRPIWLGYCLLSRLELSHGTFQLPGALRMKEPLKHNNKRKLGR